LSGAEAIGLTQNGNLFGNIGGIIFWNSKTTSAIRLLVFQIINKFKTFLYPLTIKQL